MQVFARQGTFSVPNVVEHFACLCIRCRLVRVLLGEDAISKRKLEYGNPMTVLGIKIEANLAGVVFTPDEEKVRTPRTGAAPYIWIPMVCAFAGCKLDKRH